jgi:hypothetical protein
MPTAWDANLLGCESCTKQLDDTWRECRRLIQTEGAAAHPPKLHHSPRRTLILRDSVRSSPVGLVVYKVSFVNSLGE